MRELIAQREESRLKKLAMVSCCVLSYGSLAPVDSLTGVPREYVTGRAYEWIRRY